MTMTCPQNLWQVSEKQPVPPQLGFMCVGGHFRVERLLGSDGSGALNSNSSSIHLSEPSKECLSRERYQDGSWDCSEDWASRALTFKAQSWIQCVHSTCWQPRHHWSMLVWQRRHIWSYCPRISWNLSWWFDLQASARHQEDVLVCLPNGTSVYAKKDLTDHSLDCTAFSDWIITYLTLHPLWHQTRKLHGLS